MTLRPAGYGAWTDRQSGSVTKEMDTIQCCHCQKHVFVKPGTVSTVYLIPQLRPFGTYKEEPGAWCSLCNKPVCLPCHAIGTCTPVMKQIEAAETATAERDIRARLGWQFKLGDK